MKILMVNKFLYPNGGSETYIFEIGKYLKSIGAEVQYFGMEHEGRIVGNDENLYTSNMDFHNCSKLQKLSYPFKVIYSREAAKKITRILHSFKPDIVHLNNINFQLTPSIIEAVVDYNIKNGGNIKIIATAHDYQWVCPNHMMCKPDGELCFDCEGGDYKQCMRNRCIHGSRMRSTLGTIEATFYSRRGTYGLIDKVICPSEFIKTKLETNPDLRGHCVAMHNFMYAENEKNTEHSEGLAGKRYVLYFGRYAQEKGVDKLLEACRKLSNVNFVFAGTGPLKEEIKDIPNIEELGFLKMDRLKPLIEGAEFVVFPSVWYENCPFSVMETQSFGTPILASKLGGTPELVIDGQTGELCDATDVDNLTAKIDSLWKDTDRISKYKAACSKVHFDTLEEYCEKLLKIYEE